MMNTLIVILCQNRSHYIESFIDKLQENNFSHMVICDSCSIDLDKDLVDNGFINLTRADHIKKPSAWDKAFYQIYHQQLLSSYEYFFFIEDDVYSTNYNALINFIKECNNHNSDLITKSIRTQNHFPSWRRWQEQYISELLTPRQSFNPICRLSKNLVEKILQYRDTINKFNFHEIIFASLCIQYNLTYLEYIKDIKLKKYIGSMAFEPIFTFDSIPNDLINHPVKLDVNARKLKFPIDNADTL
jgi:hypothetical protein